VLVKHDLVLTALKTQGVVVAAFACVSAAGYASLATFLHNP
jgi:hypothetical protein